MYNSIQYIIQVLYNNLYLGGTKMGFKKSLSTLALFLLVVACGQKNPVVSGTFEGTGSGRNGDIKVSVVLEDTKITAINILETMETEDIAEPVYTAMLQTIVSQNNVNVDSISGATMTSDGFRAAVEMALKTAGVNLKGKKTPVIFGGVEDAVQNFDVVVIGAGGAGLTAAIEAKNNGAATVVVLEKMASVGGNTVRSGGGINAAETRIQKSLGVPDTKETHFRDTMAGGDLTGDPELVHFFTDNAADTVHWIIDYVGAEYLTDYLIHFGGHSYARAVAPKYNSGENLIAKLKDKAEEIGVIIKTSTEATDLIMADGRVAGVTAKKSGQTITFNASKSVIIASGGFVANVEMRKKYNPMFDESYKLYTVSPGSTGDGIVMAQAIGADVTQMDYIQSFPTSNPITGELSDISFTRFAGAILVNQKGNRFVEELERRDVISTAILAEPENYAYLVWNEEIGKAGNTMANNQDEFEKLTEQGLIVKADTMAEAAEFFKIPADQLNATVAKVNEYAKAGIDPDFNHRGGLVDLSVGPFYIERITPSVHHTMGGLKIDVNTRVLDKNGNPIPGLYAAGEVTGGIHGANRLGGNAIADILVFGRAAGKNAALGI